MIDNCNDISLQDYADFEMANDDDQIMRFLKLESEATTPVTQNGVGDHQTNVSLNLLFRMFTCITI